MNDTTELSKTAQEKLEKGRKPQTSFIKREVSY